MEDEKRKLNHRLCGCKKCGYKNFRSGKACITHERRHGMALTQTEDLLGEHKSDTNALEKPSSIPEVRFQPRAYLRVDICGGNEQASRIREIDINSTIVSILNLKDKHNWSNESVEDLLHVLKEEILSDNKNFPSTLFLAKKELQSDNLGFEKIDACRGDCVLFRQSKSELQNCDNCYLPRYKLGTKQAIKVLYHFSIIQRLQKLFTSLSFAELVTKWCDHMSTDGLIRSTPDTPAWKCFDTKFPQFAQDPRNLRLGLAIDGMNPFQKMSSSYCIIPVVLVIYNLPSHLLTKHKNCMLAMLIPGKKQPTNMNTYLCPLVEELQLLWKGVRMIDVSRPLGNRDFTLRAILLWTIHDFKAYGMTAGCVTQGKIACPICGPNLDSRYSQALSSTLYPCCRRFLPLGHHMRDSKECFPEQEIREPPKKTSVEEWMQWARQREAWKKHGNTSKRKKAFQDPATQTGVKELSCFYSLEYFPHLLIRHVIDIMHLEKNISEMVLFYLTGKKDTSKTREDMEQLGVRKELWMHNKDPLGASSSQSSSRIKPPAPYVLSKQEWDKFCRSISELKLPSSFGTNLKFSFESQSKDIPGLKSHTHHVLLQDIIPLAIRGLLKRGPRMAIIYLGRLFKKICSHSFNPDERLTILEEAAEIICLLEREFPLAVCTISFHLIYHVVEELFLCGPVSTRWMYPFERFYKRLKKKVLNKARPEATIAHSYSLMEALTFASYRMGKDVHEDQQDLKKKNDIFLLGASKKKKMNCILQKQAHNFVLENCKALEELRILHADKCETYFDSWLIDYVNSCASDQRDIDDIITAMAFECPSHALHHTSMWAYGNHYRVQSIDEKLQTNDCTIIAPFYIDGELIDYVGIIHDILLLEYKNVFSIILVECKWFELNLSGPRVTKKVDEDGFIMIKTTEFMHMSSGKDQPFVNAEVMRPVFLCKNEKDREWSVLVEVQANPEHFGGHKVGTKVPHDVLEYQLEN